MSSPDSMVSSSFSEADPPSPMVFALSFLAERSSSPNRSLSMYNWAISLSCRSNNLSCRSKSLCCPSISPRCPSISFSCPLINLFCRSNTPLNAFDASLSSEFTPCKSLIGRDILFLCQLVDIPPVESTHTHKDLTSWEVNPQWKAHTNFYSNWWVDLQW